MLTQNQKTHALDFLAKSSDTLSTVSLILAQGMETAASESPDGQPLPPIFAAHGNVSNAVLIIRLDEIMKNIGEVLVIMRDEVRVRKPSVDLRGMKGVG